MSLSARVQLASVVAALVVIGNCSSHDVSLGDDAPSPNIDPTPPEPEPPPGPTPVPPSPPPCELHGGEYYCRPATDHCSGRILMGAGYECASGMVCCEQTVGTSSGGSAAVPPPGAGAGGA